VVTLAIAKVQRRRTVFRDFKVHAAYKPQLHGLRAELVRDGVLEIEGPRLRPGNHIALQGIFVKLFAPSRPISLIRSEHGADPRLAGLMVTQCILDDGWLGFALGQEHPQRVARLTR
jgi:hypothetical protein